MQIEFVRSGGFAGIRLTANVDSRQLPAAEASKLEKMVQEAGFFALPQEIRPAAAGPDRFQYRITVSMDQKAHTVLVDEAALPERVRPLIDYLTSLARAGGNP